MRPAAERLAEELAAVAFAHPQIPVLHNVDVSEAADAVAMRERLTRQLYSPVRWVDTVRTIAARAPVVVLEAGPGKVLTGLAKRIDKSLNTLPVFDPAGLDRALEASHG
jgi:[acyl-carrier-protein] S-malonyltransferase